MKEVLELLKNVKRGPKTSIVGIILCLFGGYLIYTMDTSLTWASVEVGIFVVGLYLCLTSDGLFAKKDEDLD